ncbi:MAG: hypothetical protein WA655_15020 [Candidatus Korobacteraceae bacterium]
MDDLSEALARVCRRLEQLEDRVSAIEHMPQPAIPLPVHNVVAQAQVPSAENALPQPAGVFPVIGRAMLGIAGAYVLRAVAESGAVPKLAVVILALLYGGTWLVWATRLRVPTRLASTTYALTAGLILAPMLGELTLRFHILPSPVTAALLGAFVLAATGLAWKRKLSAVVWVAVVTGVGSALALLVLSRDLAPYLAVLLLIVAVSEFAAAGKRWQSLRALVAPAVDIAIANATYTFSLPESSRAEYVPIAKPVLLAFPLLLFLIYGASVTFRTIWLRQKVTVFEIVQATISFVLAGFSWLWFAPGAGITAFGVFCWLLAAACYTATFVCFNRGELRNYRVYAAWSAGLVLAGSFLILPPPLAALLLGAAAVVATAVGVKIRRLMPGYQGLAYLAAAAFVSGLLRYVGLAMAGTLPSAPVGTVWIVAGCAILCYAFGSHFEGTRWNQRLLRFLLALPAVSAVAAFSVSALASITAAGLIPGTSQVAIVRTLIICGCALALAYSGVRWQQVELIWSAYLALAFVGTKLLFEDLRFGHSGSIAISLFAYAVALIIVPRLGRTAPGGESVASPASKQEGTTPMR